MVTIWYTSLFITIFIHHTHTSKKIYGFAGITIIFVPEILTFNGSTY
mgnify:CR=1 FL=1